MRSILAAMILVSSVTAFAKGGGSKPMTPTRFLSEAVEHSLLQAQAGGVVSGVQATVNDTETITVMIINEQGNANFLCKLVDEFSQGGTVVKKDVLCVIQ